MTWVAENECTEELLFRQEAQVDSKQVRQNAEIMYNQQKNTVFPQYYYVSGILVDDRQWYCKGNTTKTCKRSKLNKKSIEKHHITSVPSSLKTGAVRRYCRILRSLSKGHSTFFHVMNSITCLASSQNFCSTVKIDSVRDHRLCFVSSFSHTELMPLKLHFNRCIRQWTKSGCFCCYVTVFSQPSIVTR